MTTQMRQQEQFINPYRQNRRCFNRYFNNSLYLKVSQDKNAARRQPEDFLDNVSRASSIKIRENPFQNQFIYQKEIKEEPQDIPFLKSNRRNISMLENPQICNILSKHVENNISSNKKIMRKTHKKSYSSFSTKTDSKSFSINEMKKTPKITQFSRNTFYSNFSSARSSYNSKKQIQDNLHSSSSLGINSQKIMLCKKTLPKQQGNSLITCEVYMMKKRVGIDAQILGGSSKQIKFRLIMNQSDTKNFQLYWIFNVEQFVDKCIVINDNGIKLKLGVFYIHKKEENKLNSLRQTRTNKNYLKNYESFIKNRMSQKVTPIRVGNVVFHRQYENLTKNLTKNQIEEKKNINLNDNLEKKQQKDQVNPKILCKEKQIIELKIQQKLQESSRISLNPVEQIDQSIRLQASNIRQTIVQNTSQLLNPIHQIQQEQQK